MRNLKLSTWALLCLSSIILFRNAWMADDAYITLRTVDNFINGYGLRWNISERVQSFTSPLWTLLISLFYFITHEEYFTTILISVVTSLAAIYVISARSTDIAQKSLLILILLSSPAFIFYGVSGLENPIAFLTLALFFNEYFGKGRLKILTLLFSLIFLTRIDLIILTILPLVYTFYKNREEGSWIVSLPGFIPIAIWMIFSVIYYGFFLPNTAYAKLPLGIPQIILNQNGLNYYLHSLDAEPITIFIIILSLCAVFRFRNIKILALVFSILAYLFYIIHIGGDFMSGRFLGAPFVVALCLLIEIGKDKIVNHVAFCLIFAVLALGMLSNHPPLLEGKESCCGKIDENGIATEKQFYFSGTGLLNYRPGIMWPNFHFAEVGRKAKIENQKLLEIACVGMAGYFAGPNVHILDHYGLPDPLISRLPAMISGLRPGHYLREFPVGYTDSVLNAENKIEDPALAKFYDELKIVTQDKLFSKKRFETILKFQFNEFQPLLIEYASKLSRSVQSSQLQVRKNIASPWNAPTNVTISQYGLTIKYPSACSANTIEMSLDHNNNYLVSFLLEDRIVQQEIIYESKIPGSGLQIYELLIQNILFDSIKIYNISSDPLASIGHIITDTKCN